MQKHRLLTELNDYMHIDVVYISLLKPVTVQNVTDNILKGNGLKLPQNEYKYYYKNYRRVINLFSLSIMYLLIIITYQTYRREYHWIFQFLQYLFI